MKKSPHTGFLRAHPQIYGPMSRLLFLVDREEGAGTVGKSLLLLSESGGEGEEREIRLFIVCK